MKLQVKFIGLRDFEFYDSDGHLRYVVRSVDEKTPTIIAKVAKHGSETVLAEYERRDDANRFRRPGEEHFTKIGDFIHSKPFSHSRTFESSHSKYTWKDRGAGKGARTLYDASGSIVATSASHQTNSRTLEGTLDIHENGLSIADDIVLTYVLLKRSTSSKYYGLAYAIQALGFSN